YGLARPERAGMAKDKIIDWDDAYTNVSHIPEGPSYVGRWTDRARAFRQGFIGTGRMRQDISYGAHERTHYDLFMPEALTPKGLMIFVHGGYYIAGDKSMWSH